tara:strand:- start:1030 stop:1890 length:861 start_codon:yes stop_codon:yes gene_type:complete
MIVELDTTYTTIGNPISYSVKVQSPKDKIIQFPDWILEDPLEVRSSDFAISTPYQIGNYKLVFWDTGRVAIPGLEIQVLYKDSTFAYKMNADTMFMEVVSITEQDPSFRQSGGSIMPIKDPVPVKYPVPWRTIILSMSLVLLLVGIIWIWTKRLKKEVYFEEKPDYLEQPDAVALQKLDLLDGSGLLAEGDIKEFYSRLSLIIREYAENSLYIRALEMTTEEIRGYRLFFPYTNIELEEYIQILSSADMVKYAKHRISIEQCSKDLLQSRTLVQDTIKYWKISSNF